MAIILNRFDGGFVDYISPKDIGDNEFLIYTGMRCDLPGQATKAPTWGGNVSNVLSDRFVTPGQGYYVYRTEWDSSATPQNVSSLFRVATTIVNSAGAWEINIHRCNATFPSTANQWDTEFIDETSAKGGWERATSNRLVQGSSDITFSGASAGLVGVTGSANLANFEVGEYVRVLNTTLNNGYYQITIKDYLSNGASVQLKILVQYDGGGAEASTSAYLYPLPDISMFAVNGDLRVSNGNFYDDHASQWYGPIKRDFWGEVVGVAENLSETAFTTHAKWDVTGVADDSGGNCAFVFAGGTLNGTLIQTAANRAETAENSVGYSFTYTIAVTTAPDGDFTLALSAFSSASVSLPVTAGVHTVYFTSAAAASAADFTITAAETTSTQGEFTMDTVSVQRSRYGLNSGRYVAPPMQESYSNWKLQNQELVAPTIVAGSRVGDATSAANEVAIHIAGAHHEFKELMPNSIDRTFTGGGTAWANVDIGTTFNETTDLSLVASAADQYCTCPVASAPMTAAREYKLQFDVANLISTWTIQDFTGVQKFGTVYANGKEQSIKFTVDTAITGGFRLVADTDDASADFDNFSLSSIDWPEKAIDVEWNARDRVTATFVYDFVQESELGKVSSGEIGIPMGTIITEDIARAFMAEVYTGAAQASWNRRITAIRLYYKFHDDPDWYEIVTLDVNKGWSESELVFDAENTGFWCPIMAAIQHTGTSDATGGSGTTLESDAHALSIYDLISLGSTTEIRPDSMCSIVESQVTNTITLPAAAVNSIGVSTSYDAQPWCGGTISTTAVATFYIPFNGEKAFSYFTNTGRAAKINVPAIRWKASDTDGSKVLIGNIDTTDDNSQTIRERGRVYLSPDGMPDTFILAQSKDISNNDEIIGIKYFNRHWFVIMRRSVVMLDRNTLRKLIVWGNVGCDWPHAIALTPYGLCLANNLKVVILPSGEELSWKIKTTYQGLSFAGSSLGYNSENDSLIVIYNTLDSNCEELIYSFKAKAWSKNLRVDDYTATPLEAASNIISRGPDNVAEFVFANTLASLAINAKGLVTAPSSTTAGDIKSKEFDNGYPQKNKIIANGYLTYLSGSAVTVEVYLNSISLPSKTIYLDAKTSLTNVLLGINLTAKLFSFRFYSTSNDFKIDEFLIPDEEITIIDA